MLNDIFRPEMFTPRLAPRYTQPHGRAGHDGPNLRLPQSLHPCNYPRHSSIIVSHARPSATCSSTSATMMRATKGGLAVTNRGVGDDITSQKLGAQFFPLSTSCEKNNSDIYLDYTVVAVVLGPFCYPGAFLPSGGC